MVKMTVNMGVTQQRRCHQTGCTGHGFEFGELVPRVRFELTTP